jgi:hypothetical protein
MSVLSGLRRELEATELQPISIEMEEKELQKIAIYVIGMGILLFIAKGIISNIFKFKNS